MKFQSWNHVRNKKGGEISVNLIWMSFRDLSSSCSSKKCLYYDREYNKLLYKVIYDRIYNTSFVWSINQPWKCNVIKVYGREGGIPLHTEYRNSPKFHELQALVLMVVGKKNNNPLMKKNSSWFGKTGYLTAQERK